MFQAGAEPHCTFALRKTEDAGGTRRRKTQSPMSCTPLQRIDSIFDQLDSLSKQSLTSAGVAFSRCRRDIGPFEYTEDVERSEYRNLQTLAVWS